MSLNQLTVTYEEIQSLVPYARNARTHSKRQIRQIADSIHAFGFTNPVLVNRSRRIIAGHGRVDAAKLLGMKSVPTICLENLNEDQIRAYILADNRLAEKAGWDNSILAIELQHLTSVDLGFDVSITGFEVGEIDLILQEAAAAEEKEEEEPVEISSGPAITKPGDIWLLGDHRLMCGDALEESTYSALMNGQKADVVFADPPYNVKIDGNVCGKGAKQITFNQVDVARAADYAAEDADVTLQLHQVLWPQLEAMPRLKDLYESIEQPLVPVLYRMERTGVLVDRELLKKQSAELAARMLELQSQAHIEAGGAFNVDSPKQLQEILFGKLGIPVIRKTPTGQPSTAEDVLEELAASYPLPKLILEYRGVAKLKSTYTDKLPEQINPQTGRIHTSYHQAVAATGRLSSSDPNLQNIPIRTSEGRRIRQAFVAPPGHSLVAADYSQIELRIMAHLSGDASLLKAFAEDRDVHLATAAEVFGLPLNTVTADQRRSAKAINFGLIYGMSAFGLARQLSIGRSEAQKYVDLYFERYPGVKRYMDETKQKARDAGFVETIFGRRLYLPEILSRNQALRQYAERSAINAPMQGTAADIIKRAMIEVDAWLQTSKAPARLIMQVHDELVLEVADAAVDTVVRQVRQHMVRAAELSVPLKVDVGIGRNWDEAH